MTSPPPPSSPTPGRARERRRLSIVEAARDVILEQGYDSTSMEQIATAAGMTKKTLYNHFQSKEALLGAVLDTVTDAIGTGLRDDTGPADDLAEGLVRYGRQFVAAMSTPPGLEIYRLAIVVSRRYPQVGRALHMASMVRVIGSLARYIELKAGEPRTADPLQLARQFVGMLSFLVQSALLGAEVELDAPETQRYIRDAVQAVLAGAGMSAGRGAA